VRTVYVLAALAAITAFSGCTKVSDGANHIPGVLRVAIHQDVLSLNPLLGTTTTDNLLAKLLFEPLISADDKGNPFPILASNVPSTENGGISADGLTITYHLRSAKWTDGQPVTAHDVKWTWQAIMNHNNNVISRHVYDDIASIDTPDDRTIVVHLIKKFGPFVNSFFAESDTPYVVLPAHVLQKYPNFNTIPFNQDPNVTDGPFTLIKWAHNDRITFAPNAHFFLGTPKLKEVIIEEISDENTSVNLLRTHDVDWIFEASPQLYRLVENVPGTKLAWVSVNGYETLGLNMARPLLSDLRVREAIQYALNKQEIIDKLTYGQMMLATEDLPRWMWAFNPHIQPVPENLTEARALLSQAGWSPGPDGIMQKNGTKLSLELVATNSSATSREATVQIQQMLHNAGIEVDIRFYTAQQLFATPAEGGILQLGKYDLTFNGWFAGIDPDDSTGLMCKYIPPNGWNSTRYCNPEMDNAQNIALGNYDKHTRTAAYYKIQELQAHDIPAIYLWWVRQMHPISTAFKGFDPNPVTESWNAWEWSI